MTARYFCATLNRMGEIGIPEKRRVLIPQTVPTENPYTEPPHREPAKEPVKAPEKTPA